MPPPPDQNFIFIFTRKCLFARMCIYAPDTLVGQKKSVGSPRTATTRGCEPMVWFLEEPAVLLTPESSLQLRVFPPSAGRFEQLGQK